MSRGATTFEARLRAIGRTHYHHRHPFNVRMHEGRLRPDEIRTWVRNRYYYQTRIPVKDTLILERSDEPDFRSEWARRLDDHQGREDEVGGLELWLHLAQAVGLDRDEVAALRDVLPGVRRACDDYVAFVEGHSRLEGVAASLTELFAGELMQGRIAAFERHYSWVKPEGLRYFRNRTAQAPRDAEFALRWVCEQASTPEDQERCLVALETKCKILWRLLDEVEEACARPRLSRAATLRQDPRDDGPLCVLPERAIRLNDSGLEVLALCDGRHSVDEIVAELRRAHPEAGAVLDDVRGFLSRLERLGVLVRAA